MSISKGADDIAFDLIIHDDKDIAFSIVVLFYGSPEDPLMDIEKAAMRSIVAEAVESNLLPGQTAYVNSGTLK